MYPVWTPVELPRGGFAFFFLYCCFVLSFPVYAILMVEGGFFVRARGHRAFFLGMAWLPRSWAPGRREG